MSEEISVPEERGTVTIPVSRYERLLEDSKQKSPVTVVQKSPEQVAQDNQSWGIVFLIGSVAMAVVGLVKYRNGVKQEQEIVEEFDESTYKE